MAQLSGQRGPARGSSLLALARPGPNGAQRPTCTSVPSQTGALLLPPAQVARSAASIDCGSKTRRLAGPTLPAPRTSPVPGCRDLHDVPWSGLAEPLRIGRLALALPLFPQALLITLGLGRAALVLLHALALFLHALALFLHLLALRFRDAAAFFERPLALGAPALAFLTRALTFLLCALELLLRVLARALGQLARLFPCAFARLLGQLARLLPGALAFASLVPLLEAPPHLFHGPADLIVHALELFARRQVSDRLLHRAVHLLHGSPHLLLHLRQLGA